MEERERDTKEQFKKMDDKFEENERRRKEREEVNKRMKNLEDALKSSSLESRRVKKSVNINAQPNEEIDASTIQGDREKETRCQ